MNLKHVALVSSGEEKADRFFVEILGLEKRESKVLPRGLSQALFGVNEDLKIIKYQGEKTVLEVFIQQAGATPHARIEHVCFEADDPDAILTKCRGQGVEIRQVPKGDKIITFIVDKDGHLFELI